MIDLIEHDGHQYPVHQAQGFAAQFAFPFANKLLTGYGYDIGCNRKEWALPGSIPIDPALAGCEWSAENLPAVSVDFIFSSHCLEHLNDWVGVLNYWHGRMNPGAVLFLYLPHPSQSYWRPWSNRKHVNLLEPDHLRMYLEYGGKWGKVTVTGSDLNASFYAIAERI